MKRPPDLNMSPVIWHHMMGSVGKWSKTLDDREQLTILCVEKFLFALANHEIKPETFENYCSRMFHNACVSYWRSKNRRRRVEILQAEMGDEWGEYMGRTENPHEETNVLLDFDSFIRSVDSPVLSHLAKEESYQEISDATGITMGTVKTRVCRGRVKWAKNPQISGYQLT